MSIRIVRNVEGNCITFRGTSLPAYFNACLSGEVNADDPTLINIVNDIRTADGGVDVYEMYAIPYTEFVDADGNAFADAQAAADYITEQGNVLGLGDSGADLNGSIISFRLDQTSTSVIMSNGFAFGVNTIKAIPDADGTIHIHAIGAGLPNEDGDVSVKEHFQGLEPGLVEIDGQVVPGGLQDVTNALNELFTVGAFASTVVTDPHSTMIADVAGESAGGALAGTAVDPVGDDDAAGTQTGYNHGGYLTDSTIDQAGEYFSFDVRVESVIGFGVVDINEDATNYTEADFCNGSGNGHYGYKWSLWFHPTPNGPWTLYGKQPGHVAGPGWSGSGRFSASDEGADWLAGNPVKLRVGIDANSFIHCDYYDVSEGAWVMMARSNYPVPEGSQYKLGVKFGDTVGRLASPPKVHEVEEDTTTVVGTSAVLLSDTAAGDITGAGVTVADASGSNDGFITDADVISGVGQYWEVSSLSSGHGHLIGLVFEDDLDATEWQTLMDDGPQADASGYFFAAKSNTANKFNASYKSLTGNSYGHTKGPGYFQLFDTVRVGIDSQGRAYASVSNAGGPFLVAYRTTGAVPAGNYRLAWRAKSNGASFGAGGLTQHESEQAPTMQFRYVESPDGVYHYPVFATAEEANWYDQHHDGTTGTGESVVTVFPDDPTFTQWYAPATGFTNDGTDAPTGGTFQGNAIAWTEVTTLTNADLAPEAYTDQTVTVDELAAVNIPLAPVDVSYSTTISGQPAGLTLVGGSIVGNAPEVTGYIGTNDSDDYTITVTRANSYGSSSGTLTLRVNNLTQLPTAPTGTTLVTDPATLVGDDLQTLGAIELDDVVEAGRRLIIPRAWVEANVLPLLDNDPAKRVYMGVAASGADYDAADLADWDAHIMWRGHASGHEAYLYNGSTTDYFVVSSATQAFYDYAIEMDDSGNLAMIACNVNAINLEPAVSEGGQFSNSLSRTYTAPATVTMFLSGVTMDISGILTNLSEIDIPAAPVTNLTSWNTALDFSGSSERAEMVSTSDVYNPMMMGGSSSTVAAPATAGQTTSSGHPWAACVVFQHDGNSSNQHIWNLGEGAGSTDDNIYMRIDASGNVYFGWGRAGALNECRISQLGVTGNTSHWWAFYVGFNGTRLSGADATAANLADCFDFKVMSTNDPGPMDNIYSITTNTASVPWTSTGGRMDRQLTGQLSIGGRGSNRSFHGKVASFVVATLKHGQAMPDDAEAKKMITDPLGWIEDYKVGGTFRHAYFNTNQNWDSSSDSYRTTSTQVWVMGDGANDSYVNGIRNQVAPTDQNYTKLNLVSMVSNDIVNVSIEGLS